MVYNILLSGMFVLLVFGMQIPSGLSNTTSSNNYLKAAGMNVDLRFREMDMELCSILARAYSGFKRKTETRTCTVTKKDQILKVWIRVNGEQNCAYNNNHYAANTDFSFFNSIKYKYQKAISFALNDNNTYAVNILKIEEFQHEGYIKTNMNTAILSGTASSKPLWGRGGVCDLTLMGRVRMLDV